MIINYSNSISSELDVNQDIIEGNFNTLKDLVNALRNLSPKHDRCFTRHLSIRAHSKGTVLDPDSTLEKLDEINLFSPMSGG